MRINRIIAILLCIAVFAGLSACGSAEPKDLQIEEAENGEVIDPAKQMISQSPVDFDDDDSFNVNKADKLSDKNIPNADYVMIYNPLIFDENKVFQNSNCKSGNLGSQILTNIRRAEGLEEDITFPTPVTPGDFIDLSDGTGVTEEVHRAGGLNPVYSVGDKHKFYHYDKYMMNRIISTFECVYAGKYSYIWSLNGSISAQDAKKLADEFDNGIYKKDTTAFGPGRFTENGGKVNMLCYPMNDNLLGFFTMQDIFATGEVMGVEGFNYDHAIINIATNNLSKNPSIVFSTLAHEYQHLICASDSLVPTDANWMNTWLNEAMSAYAEELNYPGCKFENNYNLAFYISDLYRNGQSVYNFNVENDPYIGAYGNVFLFEEYLRKNCGDKIFTGIHTYWRKNADNVPNALAKIVPAEFYQKIEKSVSYPAEISGKFKTAEEKWMSKLTLSYLLETNDMTLARLEKNKDTIHMYYLYDSPYSATIEGGGRIIVKTLNGSFSIPSDADKNLIYVALDSNFKPTGFYSAFGTLTGGKENDTFKAETNNQTNKTQISAFCLAKDKTTAENIASGIAEGMRYTLTETKACADHKDLIDKILNASENPQCGLILVFLNDKSYSASGLSVVIEDLAKDNIGAVLLNSKVPPEIFPWTVTYDYSGIASSYSDLGRYKKTELKNLGNQIGKYVQEAFRTGDPVSIFYGN